MVQGGGGGGQTNERMKLREKKTFKGMITINCAVLDALLRFGTLVVCWDVFVVSFNERHVEHLSFLCFSIVW